MPAPEPTTVGVLLEILAAIREMTAEQRATRLVLKGLATGQPVEGDSVASKPVRARARSAVPATPPPDEVTARRAAAALANSGLTPSHRRLSAKGRQ